MQNMDELWRATVENQKYKVGPVSQTNPPTPELRGWIRYDLAAKRFRGTNSTGPLLEDVVRRITLDLDNGHVVQDIKITSDMTARQLHQNLPTGVENIETILVYQPTQGHPDPGKPLAELPDVPQQLPDKEPEEDARIIDAGMKRSLEEPSGSERMSSRSKIFGFWRADENTEWGNKADFPVIANSRDLAAFSKLNKTDLRLLFERRELSTDVLDQAERQRAELEEFVQL